MSTPKTYAQDIRDDAAPRRSFEALRLKEALARKQVDSLLNFKLQCVEELPRGSPRDIFTGWMLPEASAPETNP
jgi:hypothetical protein